MRRQDRGGSDPPKRKRPGIGQTILRPDFQTKRAEVDTRCEPAGQDPQQDAQDAEIIDLRTPAVREALFWHNFDRDIRQRTRNRIRRLRAMLSALDYRLAAGDRNTQDVLDVGTLELCDLAAEWFPLEMRSPGDAPLGYERHGSWAWKWGEG
jgi:hypothetical protein